MKFIFDDLLVEILNIKATNLALLEIIGSQLPTYPELEQIVQRHFFTLAQKHGLSDNSPELGLEILNSKFQ